MLGHAESEVIYYRLFVNACSQALVHACLSVCLSVYRIYMTVVTYSQA